MRRAAARAARRRGSRTTTLPPPPRPAARAAGDARATGPGVRGRLGTAAAGGAWSRFVDVSAPRVYGFARRHGLQDADAADLTQDVLRSVLGAAGRLEYDPARGSFRGWLFTIA